MKKTQLKSISRCCKLFINFDLLAREAQNQNLTLISIVEFLKTEACDSYIYSQINGNDKEEIYPLRTSAKEKDIY